MKMIVIDKSRAETDTRFRVDALSGIENLAGVDLCALATRALYRLPAPSHISGQPLPRHETVIQVDSETFRMWQYQVELIGQRLEAHGTFSAIPFEVID